MKSQILYVATLALHIGLLWLFTHLHFYRRNSPFWLWLMTSLGMNVALLTLAWAGEIRAFTRACLGGDVLWYALALASLIMALWRYSDPVNRIVLRGSIALVLLTLAARRGGSFGAFGAIGARFADAVNWAYLAPVAYMLWALSGVRLDRLPVWAKRIPLPLRGIGMTAREAFGWAACALRATVAGARVIFG